MVPTPVRRVFATAVVLWLGNVTNTAAMEPAQSVVIVGPRHAPLRLAELDVMMATHRMVMAVAAPVK